jgi:hypothetical protein
MSFIIGNARFHVNENNNSASSDRKHLDSINDEHPLSSLTTPPEMAVLKPENKMPFKRPHLSFSVDHSGMLQSAGHTVVTLSSSPSSSAPTPPPPPPLLNVSTIVRSRQDSPVRLKKEEHLDKCDSPTDRLIDVENSDPQQPRPISRNTIPSSDLCSAFVKLDADAFPLRAHGTISVSTIGASPILARSDQLTPVNAAITKKCCSDEEFWRHYGPHNLYDQNVSHFENRTLRVYVGRYGDQVRVFKPIGVVRKNQSVLCRILGVYCDFVDSLSTQQVQSERDARLRDFIWPLSADRHADNVTTIRRLIRENPVSERLPYVDLPSGVVPAKSFSIRVKRKHPSDALQNGVQSAIYHARSSNGPKSISEASLESHDYCEPGPSRRSEDYEYLQGDFTESEFNPLRSGLNDSPMEEEDEFADDGEDDDEDDGNEFDFDAADDIASAEKEMIMLAKLAERTEQELRAVATGLKRFSKKDQSFGDSDEGKTKKKRTTNGKGIQPAHCPYCMQLFSATFNAKLHYNGRYKGNGKHISCKKRQEMGDQNLNPIVCIPNCLVCEAQKPKTNE